MIRANELRIGNWTLFDLEEVYEQITPRRLGFILQANSKNQSHPFKPIPLTEEILLKCGFQKYAPSIFNEDRYVLGFISLTVTTSKDILFNGIHTKHLHQLQNLYFALTGEELEINFSPQRNGEENIIIKTSMYE